MIRNPSDIKEGEKKIQSQARNLGIKNDPHTLPCVEVKTKGCETLSNIPNYSRERGSCQI